MWSIRFIRWSSRKILLYYINVATWQYTEFEEMSYIIHFYEWLAKTKNYKKNEKTGVSKTLLYYRSYLYKICRKLNIKNDDDLLQNVQILRLLYHIPEKQIFANEEKVYFCINTLAKIYSIDLYHARSLDEKMRFFWKNEHERIRIKRALDLLYEFMLTIDYRFTKYDDCSFGGDGSFCDNNMYLKMQHPSINTPGKIVIEKKDTDYIDDEQTAKFLKVSKSTLYNLAKAGYIEKYNSTGYSVSSLNRLLEKNRVIAQETLDSDIDFDKEDEMLTCADVAQRLKCQLYQVNKYREQGHLSYQKIGKGSYLYFKQDVERFQKVLSAKKRIKKRLKS